MPERRSFEDEVEFRRTHNMVEWDDYPLHGEERMITARMIGADRMPLFHSWELNPEMHVRDEGPLEP